MHARIKFVEGLDRVAVAHRHRYQRLPGCAIHGRYIADRYSNRLVSQVAQRGVHHVEIDTLDQGLHVDQRLLWPVAKHGAVVAAAGSSFRKTLNQSHLAQLANLGSSFVIL